jgi:Ser/Thr protein kinase RdoA (MazF antagonist)
VPDRVSAVLTRPPLSDGLAAELLGSRWGLQGSLEALPGERDRNLLVRLDGEPCYVLKVANLDEDRPFLELQHAALARLTAAGVPVQSVVPATDGSTIVEVELGGAQALARLLTWLPGAPLAAIPPGDRPDGLLEDLGATMGRVARSLANLDGAAARREFQWDVLRFEATLDAHADAVTDPARRALLAQARARLGATLRPRLAGLRRSLIHNDANDHNVLVDEAGTGIAGLLDLGDMVVSVTANEAAVAAAYAMLGADDPVRSLAAVVAGFHAEDGLGRDEAAILGELVVARLATSVAISAHQARLDPDDAYLSVSETPAWTLIERLLDVGPDALRAAVEAAAP